MKEDKTKQLEGLIDELSDYKKFDEMKKLFEEVVPEGTVILLVNEDYEKSNVPDPYDTAIWNPHIDHMEFVPGVAFRREANGFFYCIEAYDIEDEESYDCWWCIDYNPVNLGLLEKLLYAFKDGRFIQDGESPDWKTADEAEEDEDMYEED